MSLWVRGWTSLRFSPSTLKCMYLKLKKKMFEILRNKSICKWRVYSMKVLRWQEFTKWDKLKEFETITSCILVPQLIHSQASPSIIVLLLNLISQVATRGAVLYFVIADLAIIDVMYQFSLGGFQDMFRQCIGISTGVNRRVSRPGSGETSRPLSGRMRPSSARNSPDLMKNADSNTGRGSPLTSLEQGAKAALKGRDLTAHMEKMVDNLTESIYRYWPFLPALSPFIIVMGIFSTLVLTSHTQQQQ